MVARKNGKELNAKNIIQYVAINSMAFIAFLTPKFIEKPIGSFSKNVHFLLKCMEYYKNVFILIYKHLRSLNQEVISMESSCDKKLQRNSVLKIS